MNTFGTKFRVTTFGESHGAGIGCVIDGLPAGLKISVDFIKEQLALRAGGRNKFATQRKEPDNFEILSGVVSQDVAINSGFLGISESNNLNSENGDLNSEILISTGTPLAIFIPNTANKSHDYDNIKGIFRPSHADFTYFHKYGLRDYRGGGRSSARETAARVAAGAIAKMLLSEFGIKISGGILGIGSVVSDKADFDFEACQRAQDCEIFALDSEISQMQKQEIENARKSHNSVGGVALVKAFGVPAGLGEPLYGKLDAKIGELMMGLNGVKAVEIGSGVQAIRMKGSEHNDLMGKDGFLSNNAGGILGGISSGEQISVRVHFKPTPSIFIKQSTQNIKGEVIDCEIKGRHDPCIAVRGAVVAQAQLALILADALLLNASAKLENLKKIYGG